MYIVSNLFLKFSFHLLCTLQFFTLCSILFVFLTLKNKTQYGTFMGKVRIQTIKRDPTVLCTTLHQSMPTEMIKVIGWEANKLTGQQTT